ncbi:MarR family transcriptional regulator [Pseudonocardia kujensis]|uniref:MarR family winged helix-turn-helix transcriptional regulator n=1 Tax=Pseudonocardia kujensis TaxID=1128675 RepID=UPI001E3CD1FE|nr:MarR family transcriptional regulator [Pseudonocardia kujensis]MCE0767872.1 MarR family transcriptional regulator [Pseudonocardia kujensis]
MHERLGNLLGAAALALSDLMLARVREAAGVSVSAAAALVVLAHAPGLSVTELGRRVGLSQPASARMVMSLEAADLARRGPGEGRTIPVALTPAGERTVREVLAARADGTEQVLAGLGEDDRRALTRLLEGLLAQLYGEVGSSDLLCRLCDRARCTDGATCPVGQAERDRGR